MLVEITTDLKKIGPDVWSSKLIQKFMKKQKLCWAVYKYFRLDLVILKV